MATRKSLHQIVKPPESALDGRIPHVFHRKGKLEIPNPVVLNLPSGKAIYIRTETEKITAYGVVAASDSMVPDNAPADPTLIHSLRHAVSARLMSEVGAYEQEKFVHPAMGLEEQSTVYHQAVTAMHHYGTANGPSLLKKAKRFIKEYGLGYQANLLGPLIRAAIDMAMEHRQSDLAWLYKEFHALYGTEKKPNPDKPKAPTKPKEEEKPGFSVMEAFDLVPGGLPDKASPAAAWGPLEGIYKVPMSPWKHAKIRSKSYWKYSEFGVFKYPWRALPSSDYRCFSIRRRRYGGTILVDMSGSMRINQNEMTAILDIAPHATIAGYGSTPGTLLTGRLVVMAEDSKKGLTAAARAMIGSGNIVDGPALRWLASKEGPRIWISDGQVTGCEEYQHQNLNIECAAICRAAKITKIPSLGHLLGQLQGH